LAIPLSWNAVASAIVAARGGSFCLIDPATMMLA